MRDLTRDGETERKEDKYYLVIRNWQGARRHSLSLRESETRICVKEARKAEETGEGEMQRVRRRVRMSRDGLSGFDSQ